jgi:uroporphyrinogen decarboxylase
MGMTSRERVLAAIHHEEPDRVPIVLGASNTTGIRANAYHGLKSRLGIQSDDHFLYNWPELGTVFPEEAVLQRLHSDVRGLHDRFPRKTYEQNESRPAHAPYISDWGCALEEVEPGVWFQTKYPLADAQTGIDIKQYPFWPNMEDPDRVVHLKEWAARLEDDTSYALMGTPWLLSIFERAMDMQGMEKFLLNMSLEPDFAEALLLKIAGLCKTLMGNFLHECGDNLDIIAIGDDLGTQNSLMISPHMYRKILKPIHADYIAFIKEHTRAKVFFHTDGDVYPLIDDFVEIGVDILNPIQVSAGKMSDLVELKKRYGKNLVFCGAIDTQRVLPFGSPDEVRTEVRRVIEILGPGGGYLATPVHTITNEVPPENILAMVDAVEEFGCYPIQS